MYSLDFNITGSGIKFPAVSMAGEPEDGSHAAGQDPRCTGYSVGQPSPPFGRN